MGAMSLREFLAGELADPEVRDAWESCAVGRALALWLISYRDDRQLDFQALADRLGIDAERLAELEGGDRDPSAACLLWLSRTLGVAIDLLVERGLPGEGGDRLTVDARSAEPEAVA